MAILSCNNSADHKDIVVVKENERAVEVFIPSNFVSHIEEAELSEEIVVRMPGVKENMLGEYRRDNYGVFFKPLVGLQAGGRYEVFIRGDLVTTLDIPAKASERHSSLKAIYPSADTLPENLLKFYINFTSPMRQGVSERYLTVFDGKGDTLHDIFLNLNTELWDEEGKQLTIWLDPGRIKRGLQPNQKAGKPLTSGNMYTLGIARQWPNLQGGILDQAYSKQFIAGIRDIQSPDPMLWGLNVPASGSRQALTIYLNEPLDYALLKNTITVTGRDGTAVNGRFLINSQERVALFYPANNWEAGIYYLKIDSRLEDLAGNNLNRLFDRDLLKDKKARTDEYYTRQFSIN